MIFDRETATRTSVLISAISLGQWLERLTTTDLMLVTRRLEGYTLMEMRSPPRSASR